MEVVNWDFSRTSCVDGVRVLCCKWPVALDHPLSFCFLSAGEFSVLLALLECLRTSCKPRQGRYCGWLGSNPLRIVRSASTGRRSPSALLRNCHIWRSLPHPLRKWHCIAGRRLPKPAEGNDNRYFPSKI